MAANIANALRYSLAGKPLPKGQRWPDPDVTADQITQQILRCRWEVRRGDAIKPHSTE